METNFYSKTELTEFWGLLFEILSNLVNPVLTNPQPPRWIGLSERDAISETAVSNRGYSI